MALGCCPKNRTGTAELFSTMKDIASSCAFSDSPSDEIIGTYKPLGTSSTCRVDLGRVKELGCMDKI
jgi:hypothetical protein